MTKSIKGLLCGGMAAGVMAASAMPAVAQLTLPPHGGVHGVPEYRVELVGFKAVDESGPDHCYYLWPPSWCEDEPYWVVSATGPIGSAGVTYKTRTFGDVDSGESRTFAYPDKCVYPRDCTSAAAGGGIGVSVQLIEEDSDQGSAIVAKYGETFGGSACDALKEPQYVVPCRVAMKQTTKYVAQWLKDDPIDSQTLFFSSEDLLRRLPGVGNSLTEVRHFGSNSEFPSGDADYDLTVRVTRVK